MRRGIAISALLVACILLGHCGSGTTDPVPLSAAGKVEVVVNDIPYPTERNLRVGYTLRFWKYEDEGLELVRVHILDDASRAVLRTLEGRDFQYLIKPPLPPLQGFTWDPFDHYYLSVQLPLPLDGPRPPRVSHRIELRDTATGATVLVDGASFLPRYEDQPVLIASPLRGTGWMLYSQSTMEYHFYVLLFMDGGIWRPERFAFDTLQFREGYDWTHDGRPGVNDSYFAYGEVLYAVADGEIVTLRDGRAENNGNLKDAPPTTEDEYPGNYIVQAIGDGLYAGYAHCMLGGFFVAEGDYVREGQPIARLGNSGGSGEPHLHFQIMDGTDFFRSQGVPFVLREYTKLNEFLENGQPLNPPVETFHQAMMEQMSLVEFP